MCMRPTTRRKAARLIVRRVSAIYIKAINALVYTTFIHRQENRRNHVVPLERFRQECMFAHVVGFQFIKTDIISAHD